MVWHLQAQSREVLAQSLLWQNTRDQTWHGDHPPWNCRLTCPVTGWDQSSVTAQNMSPRRHAVENRRFRCRPAWEVLFLTKSLPHGGLFTPPKMPG